MVGAILMPLFVSFVSAVYQSPTDFDPIWLFEPDYWLGFGVILLGPVCLIVAAYRLASARGGDVRAGGMSRRGMKG
jgi:hypothetical protein